MINLYKIIQKIIIHKKMKKNNGKYYNCAFLEYKPEIHHKNPLPSSFILYHSLNFLPFKDNPINDIQKILKYKSKNKTMWAIRNEQGEFSIEYYFCYHKLYPENSLEKLKPLFEEFYNGVVGNAINCDYQLISINPISNKIKGFNYYYTVIDKNLPVIEINGFKVNSVNTIFYTAFYNFKSKEVTNKNYYQVGSDTLIIQRLTSLCVELYPNEDSILVNELLKLPYSKLFHDKNKQNDFRCSVKNQTIIGLYIYRMQISDFLQFLQAHNYPDKLITLLNKKIKRLSHLKFDVVIDFYLKDNELIIKKTAFGGTF